MKWITRSHVHVDRVACPWLILRFIDSDAEFIFVPRNEVKKISKEINAIPFDVEDVELGHKNGKCSFEAIIEKYNLTNTALLRMAKIIHSADIDQDIDKDRIAPGLEAIAAGYSIRFPSDKDNISRQLEVYDSLFAWCKLNSK